MAAAVDSQPPPRNFAATTATTMKTAGWSAPLLLGLASSLALAQYPAITGE